MNRASPTVPITRTYWGHIVPGLQIGVSISITRAVCVPEHHWPPSLAGSRATDTASPLVAAPTDVDRVPRHAPAPPVTLTVYPILAPPTGSDEAGAVKATENVVLGPPRVGATVRPLDAIVVLGAVTVPAWPGVLGVELVPRVPQAARGTAATRTRAVRVARRIAVAV